MTAIEIESRVYAICKPLFGLIQSDDNPPDTTCQIVYVKIDDITKVIIDKYRRIGQLE